MKNFGYLEFDDEYKPDIDIDKIVNNKIVYIKNASVVYIENAKVVYIENVEIVNINNKSYINRIIEYIKKLLSSII